jgi:hypothetical protein
MRRREAGRGAAPAGLVSLTSHSGGAGAPPGTTKSPCQELADDLGVALPASGLFERTLLRYRPPAYLSAMS